jgi:tRNA(Arg) A34 adenosine deaminase TadA
MREAIQLAQAHAEAGDGGPFGAVLVRNGRVIARGWNRVTIALDPTAHAEVEAIRAAARALGDFRLTGCELYASCEPCPMCLAACYWARLDRVYFAATREDAAAAGFADAEIYRELAVDPRSRRLPLIPLPLGEAREVFARWQAKPDKVVY